MTESLVFVELLNEQGQPSGTAEKDSAHRQGLLHRAVSVVLINPRGYWLMQRRAVHKYHSGGLWSNTSCSHPLPGQPALEAAKRCLMDEMGIDCELQFALDFVYRADVGGGMVEHEHDSVFVGHFDGDPSPSAEEVEAWAWLHPDEIAAQLANDRSHFSSWFPLIFNRIHPL